ncbi:glutamate-rich protein 6B [Anolis sagrei]|uniref:glutamate-rich protein 6B n=1 Tax=Anolis sagrei TaxID=38937 RepID=UPI0035201B6C
MSHGQNVSGSGSKDQSQPETSDSLSGSESVESKDSRCLLTVENVKKLQEDYPATKSILNRQSIEAYIDQSNQFLNGNETRTYGDQEQSLTEENEAASSAQETCKSHAENTGVILKKDLHTRSSPSSVREYQSSYGRKYEVADLETQTEWSYSDISLISKKETEKKQDQRSMTKKEKYAGAESIGKKERDDIDLDSKEDSSPDEEADMTIRTLYTHEGHSVTDLCHLGCCEFCTTLLKPLPTPEELEERPEKMDKFICCRTYKDVFQCVIQELMESNIAESQIDITPHHHISQALMDSKTRKLLKEELQELGFERYREIFEQYMKFGTCVKMKFKLSDHPPKPKMPPKKLRPSPKELLDIDVEFKAEQLKICHTNNPVKRYYPNGRIFFLFFPDGTGQVYYPSGNIAILIIYVKGSQFTYIVLHDSSSHEVLAFFANQGYATCYRQKGTIWVNLNLCTGSYFDDKGTRQKHWNWWDTSCHIHAPPFQPISISLNTYIQVKMEAQDQIFLTFTHLHHCIQLNVGARLKLKDPNMLPLLKHRETVRERSKILKIRELLTNCQKILKTLHTVPPEEIDDLCQVVTELRGLAHQRHKKTVRFKQKK